MAEFVCTGCGRTGDRDDAVMWYEGSVRDIELDPDETAIEDSVFLCEDCYKRLDPDERPRWKPLNTRTGSRDHGIKGSRDHGAF